jgi:serine/threonine protein kinase
MINNENQSNKSQIQRFGRYEVIKILGEGAMGRVFLAEDPVLQRPVAIKVIALEKQINDEIRAEYLQRFAHEARASARLNHQSIVAAYDAGQQDGVPWIAFEYIKGEPLDQILLKEKKLDFERIRSIITQIASALNHAHENHIIHRDIKPANILIDSRTGIAKLTDFGVVKAPWIGLTQSGVSIGSPGYMSPEQIEGSDIDSRSDLFSLGVVFYEMITGKHPFVRDTLPATFYATINQDYAPIETLRPEITEELNNAVINLLKTTKEERISSASQLISLINMSRTFRDNTGSTPLSEDKPVIPDLRNDTFKTAFDKIRTVVSVYIQKAKHSYNTILNDTSTRIRILSVIKISARYAIDGFNVCISLAIKITNEIKKKFRTLPPGALKKTKEYSAMIFLLSGVIFLLLFAGKSIISGKGGLQTATLSRFNAFLKNDNIDSANAIVSAMPRQGTQSASTDFLSGRLELRKGNYYDAGSLFSKSTKKNREILKNNISGVLDDIELIFKEGEASDQLINISHQILAIHNYPRTTDWLENDHYWIRWNTVKVLQSAHKKVDLVKIYILDLKTAASMRTRIKACHKLGESGDKRAIPALEDASSRGYKDPFVAGTARDVLAQYFKENMDETP